MTINFPELLLPNTNLSRFVHTVVLYVNYSFWAFQSFKCVLTSNPLQVLAQKVIKMPVYMVAGETVKPPPSIYMKGSSGGDNPCTQTPSLSPYPSLTAPFLFPLSSVSHPSCSLCSFITPHHSSFFYNLSSYIPSPKPASLYCSLTPSSISCSPLPSPQLLDLHTFPESIVTHMGFF